MPKAAHKALIKAAKKKFPGDKERQDRYVYGSAIMQKPKKKSQSKTKTKKKTTRRR